MKTRSPLLDINALKCDPYCNLAYNITYSHSSQVVIMGRKKDTIQFRHYDSTPSSHTNPWTLNEWQVSNPEKRHIRWTFNWNMMYWAGAIEAKKTFLIISPIQTIANRAVQGVKPGSRFGLGGTLPELLWLQDNGYEFIPHENGEERYTLARPTLKTPTRAIIDPNYRKKCINNETRGYAARAQAIATDVKQKRDALITAKSCAGYIATHPLVIMPPLPLAPPSSSSTPSPGSHITCSTESVASLTVTSTNTAPTPMPSSSLCTREKPSSVWPLPTTAIKTAPTAATSSASSSSPALPRHGISKPELTVAKPSFFRPPNPTTLPKLSKNIDTASTKAPRMTKSKEPLRSYVKK